MSMADCVVLVPDAVQATPAGLVHTSCVVQLRD